MKPNNDTPSIRFAGFTDAWEQRKLGDFCKIDIGEFVIRTKQRDDAPYPVYNGGSSYTGFYDEFNQDGKKVIVSARGANAGFVNKCETPYWAGNSCYSIGVLDDTDWIFLYHAIKHVQLEFIKGQQSANIPSVSKEQVQKTEVACPSCQEQKKIAVFLEVLDTLITLHQRKYDQLVNIKKSMLEKMFPKNGELVPEVRFAGFTDAWEQRKLGEITEEVTRNDPSSDAPIMMITANNGFIEQSERYAFNNAGESLKKYILLKKGELAYNHGASKLRPFGSCFALRTVDNARIPFVYHCFSSGEHNPEFLSIQLNGQRVENQLRKIVSSGARMDGLLNISYEEYSSLSILLPCSEEQHQIADYFRQIDDLITLHQRKLERLQNIKKACLEKMFV